MVIKDNQKKWIGTEIFIEKAFNFLKRRIDGFDLLDKDEALSIIRKCTKISIEKYNFKTQKMVMTYILMVCELGFEYAKDYPIIIPYLSEYFSTENERSEALFNEIFNLIKKA